MVEMDKTYIAKIINLHHETRANLEFWGAREKGKTKEHIASGIGNWKQMERIGQIRVWCRIQVEGLCSSTKGHSRKTSFGILTYTSDHLRLYINNNNQTMPTNSFSFIIQQWYQKVNEYYKGLFDSLGLSTKE